MASFRCSKILGEAGKQEIYNKCSENSRSQIVYQRYMFQKLTLGGPDHLLKNRLYSLRLKDVRGRSDDSCIQPSCSNTEFSAKT